MGTLLIIFEDMRKGFVYIHSTKKRTTLYSGVTNDLARRTGEHVNNPKGFVAQYSVNHCVYFEEIIGPTFMTAIKREKEIKGWSRAKRVALIESKNPHWYCYNHEILGLEGSCPCNTYNPKRSK